MVSPFLGSAGQFAMPNVAHIPVAADMSTGTVSIGYVPLFLFPKSSSAVWYCFKSLCLSVSRPFCKTFGYVVTNRVASAAIKAITIRRAIMVKPGKSLANFFLTYRLLFIALIRFYFPLS